MLEPGGDSSAVVTQFTGTIQGSLTCHKHMSKGKTHTLQYQCVVGVASVVGVALVLARNSDAGGMCCRYMLPSDWLDCMAFWRRRENYP